MKTKLLLFAVVLGGVAMTSCRKTRYCDCYYLDGSFAGTSTYVLTTKSQAQVNCDNEATYSYYSKCELKK
jgi:hypothetical protein